MDLTPTPESLDIRDTVAALVADVSSLDVDSGDAELRVRSDELGLSLLLVPASLGGVDLDLATATLALEALGRRPTRIPWVTNIVTVPTLFRDANHLPSVQPLAEASAVGSRRFALVRPIGAYGYTSQRVDLATDVLDIRLDQLSTWTANSWAPTPMRTLTGNVDGWAVDARGSGICTLPEGTAERITAVARAGAAAFVLGAARSALDLAVQHAKQREQFGRPIGSFQAVKHMLAAATESVTLASSLVPAAAHALSAGQPSAHIDAALALRQCMQAAVESVRTAIQVHGAIGYTNETILGGLLAQVETTGSYWGPVGVLSDEIANALMEASA